MLNKKRARILEEELQESSNIFIIRAHLPVYESLDFYSLMQDNTSGRINSQLVFDTWKIIETDPFYVPVTQEDMEEHGDKLNVPNFAKDLIEKIRKRKVKERGEDDVRTKYYVPLLAGTLHRRKDCRRSRKTAQPLQEEVRK